jgi:hypothetical protein
MSREIPGRPAHAEEPGSGIIGELPGRLDGRLRRAATEREQGTPALALPAM